MEATTARTIACSYRRHHINFTNWCNKVHIRTWFSLQWSYNCRPTFLLWQQSWLVSVAGGISAWPIIVLTILCINHLPPKANWLVHQLCIINKGNCCQGYPGKQNIFLQLPINFNNVHIRAIVPRPSCGVLLSVHVKILIVGAQHRRCSLFQLSN